MFLGSKFVYQSSEEEEEEIEIGNVSSDDSDDNDDGETCLLDILDTAGQEEYSSRRDVYTRSGDCFLLVYSITDRTTFEEARALYQFLQKVKDEEHPVAALVGNKTDLVDQRQVTTDQGKLVADSLKIPFIETSAKTGDNVSEAFAMLIRATPRYEANYKVVIMGSGAVGKSSLTMRYTSNRFVEDYDPSIEDSFRKHVTITGISSEMREEGKKKKAAAKRGKQPLSKSRKESIMREKKRVRKADANVIMLKMNMLEDAPNIVTGDPVHCGSCDAILSATSVLEKTGDHCTWTCEFCGLRNDNIDMTPEEVPNGESFDFVLVPVRDESHADDEVETIATGETTPEKKERSKGMVVYCMDTSGSMKEFVRLPDLQTQWRNARDRTTHPHNNTVSRLKAIQDAVVRQLRRIKLDHPDKKVALVTFDSVVYLWGDCCHGQPIQINQNLNDFDWLVERGREYNSALELGGLEDSYSELNTKVTTLAANGGTALGPALAVSAGIIAGTPGSEVVLCTDGEPNVGIGSLSRNNEGNAVFYERIGEFSRQNNTRLSVLAVQERYTGLQHVKQCAVISGGTINVLNPLEMMRQLRLIEQNYTVATAVDVTVILHPDLVFEEQGYMQNISRLVKEVGNAAKDTDLTFRYKIKDPKKQATLSRIPFQVQISYTLKNGMRCLRVLSKAHEFTKDRKKMEEGLNVAVVGVAAIQNSAVLAAKGKTKEALEIMKTTKLMVKRGSKSSTQLEEKMAFIAESLGLRQELRVALVDDGVAPLSDRRACLWSTHSKIPSTLFHGSTTSEKEKMLKARKANEVLAVEYYDYVDG